MNKILLFILSVVLLCTTQTTYAQVDSSKAITTADTSKKIEDKYEHFFYDGDPLDTKPKSKKDFKKKKVKKKVFWGIKTRKGFTRKNQGGKLIVEVFFYMKKFEEPDPYVKYKYWFNPLTLQVEKLRKNNEPNARLLHGPYKKMVNDVVVEQGIFYKGLKHGRWIKQQETKTFKFKDTIQIEQQTLLIKEKYLRGWNREYNISYYDEAKVKIKEVIPYSNEILHGEYLFFFSDGVLAKEGTYTNGYKTGYWTEYYDNKQKHFKKSITVYPRPNAKIHFEPYILKQWDSAGHITLDKSKDKAYIREMEKREAHEEDIEHSVDDEHLDEFTSDFAEPAHEHHHEGTHTDHPTEPTKQ